jgi:2-dehydro-3-deoxygalactonokinase
MGMMQADRIAADWIAADWGTSNLRCSAMGADGRVLAEAASEDGMGRLAPDEFEPALLRLVEPWLGSGVTPVYACGMVGARQGWVEARYRSVPCTPLEAGALTPVPVRDGRLRVLIAPGLSQAKPADVMRGEETQIAGALALGGDDGVYCLPGTHSKWAHVSAGEVVSFQTYMTGELFALLSQQSVLRHGLAGAEGEAPEAFDLALSEALSRPERLAARLFTLRAEGLLDGLPPVEARARLSGLLIGAELAAARPYWLGQRVTLIGSSGLAAAYARALAAQGVAARTLDVAACTLAGLSTLLAARP